MTLVNSTDRNMTRAHLDHVEGVCEILVPMLREKIAEADHVMRVISRFRAEFTNLLNLGYSLDEEMYGFSQGLVDGLTQEDLFNEFLLRESRRMPDPKGFRQLSGGESGEMYRKDGVIFAPKNREFMERAHGIIGVTQSKLALILSLHREGTGLPFTEANHLFKAIEGATLTKDEFVGKKGPLLTFTTRDSQNKRLQNPRVRFEEIPWKMGPRALKDLSAGA